MRLTTDDDGYQAVRGDAPASPYLADTAATRWAGSDGAFRFAVA